jgi:hypothetical protein
MEKYMNKIITFARVVCLILIGVSLSSCQASEKNKWTPPKFVKEWEIKEIKPGLPHHIISMTANKNGVFVLVKAEESKYIPPKKTSEMSENELKAEKSFFGGVLSDEERKFKNIGTTIQADYYCIQQYSPEGNYIKQWPNDNRLMLSDDLRKKTGLNDYLEKPLILASDQLGNIYLTDYEGNKTLKFDSEANVLNIWKIEQENALTYEFLSTHKGMTIIEDRLYLVSEGHFTNEGPAPNVSEYDLNGKLLTERELPIPKVPSINPYEYPAQKYPFLKAEGKVNDMAVDSYGNMYILAGTIKIFKYNKDFKEVESFEPILKEGFDADVKVFNPETKKYEKYAKSWVKGFDSQKGSGFGLELRYYELDKLYFSRKDQLFVTFIGQKPFGAINAIIYNMNGKMIGYWKEQAKSNSGWYKSLTDVERIKSKEINLALAFQGESIFVGKTIQYMKGDTLRADSGILTTRSIIQKFYR